MLSVDSSPASGKAPQVAVHVYARRLLLPAGSMPVSLRVTGAVSSATGAAYEVMPIAGGSNAGGGPFYYVSAHIDPQAVQPHGPDVKLPVSLIDSDGTVLPLARPDQSYMVIDDSLPYGGGASGP
jgi:hypothetical protein